MFTLTNQTPYNLNPNVLRSFTYEPDKLIETLFTKPTFNPLNKANPVIVHNDENNVNLSEDEITELFYKATFEPSAQLNDVACELLSKTLVHYPLNNVNNAVRFDNAFIHQAAMTAKLPIASRTMLYLANTDIIPTIKDYLSDNTKTPDEVIASFGFYRPCAILPIAFSTENDFDNFIEYFNKRINSTAVTSNTTSDVQAKLNQFSKLKLNGLTESILLANDYEEDIDDYSFTNILMGCISEYIVNEQLLNKVHPNSFYMPFDITEFICPKAIVFVNLEKHKNSRGKQIDQEWDIIQKSLVMKIKIINPAKLNKLTTTMRAIHRSRQNTGYQKTGTASGKSGKLKLRRNPPKSIDLSEDIIRILKSMRTYGSMNTTKTTAYTFSKQSRRHPDNPNVPGRTQRIVYWPDWHLFLDYSGSISEENLKSQVMMAIRMAKKLDVDLYISSFSDVLSKEYLLRTKNKSISAIYKEYQQIPKVSGNTNFEQIANYINQSKVRKDRFNLCVTDFGWQAYKPYEHPKNLYYAPCGLQNWQDITYYYKGFRNSIASFYPDIDKKILGMHKV